MRHLQEYKNEAFWRRRRQDGRVKTAGEKKEDRNIAWFQILHRKPLSLVAVLRSLVSSHSAKANILSSARLKVFKTRRALERWKMMAPYGC